MGNCTENDNVSCVPVSNRRQAQAHSCYLYMKPKKPLAFSGLSDLFVSPRGACNGHGIEQISSSRDPLAHPVSEPWEGGGSSGLLSFCFSRKPPAWRADSSALHRQRCLLVCGDRSLQLLLRWSGSLVPDKELRCAQGHEGAPGTSRICMDVL